MRRLLVFPVVVLASFQCMSGCQTAPLQARVARVQNRAELIGGPRALGEVGDWLLENDKVRFVIQDDGFSRGFGVFGGGLIDADLIRPEEGRGDSTGGKGRDNFGEMFPAFFLEALAPTAVPTDAATCAKDPNCDQTTQELPPIEIERPGGDGGDAVLVVRAVGDDFLAITQTVNQLLLTDNRASPSFNFETRYILHPGAQFLEIDTKVTNVSTDTKSFPQTFGSTEVPTPFADIILFGAGNKVFTPNKAGYDMRFHLEDIYANSGLQLPAFPGLTQEFVASSSKDVSYGLFSFPLDKCADATGATCANNFAFANKAAFDNCEQCGPPVTDHTIHVPFIASAFTAAFQALPPDTMAPGSSFHVKRAFIVGRGDIADISNQVYGPLLHDKIGKLEGRVLERQRPEFVEGAEVFIEDAAGNKITEATSRTGGFFDANLRPGTYNLVVNVANQRPTNAGSIVITADKTTFNDVFVDSPAELVVATVEDNVGPVPAKVTLVGHYDFVDGFDDTHPYRGPKPLFDLSVGEEWRFTDLVPDKKDDASTRQYIETFGSSADGVVRLRAVPGTYDVYVSRGYEYDRVLLPHITLTAGTTVSLNAILHRTVDTTGYASADFHMHSQYSLDSGAKVEDRITGYAAEGLEYAVSTDHNFVVDYQPVIAKLGLEKFINSVVGIELTTIDRGHFQGYPLLRQPGDLAPSDATGPTTVDTIASRTFGSFQWALRTPQQVFDDLRKLGIPKKQVIVQINHPRDTILGYFDQYGLDATTLVPQGITNAGLKPDDSLDPGTHSRHPEFNPANFSYDFDAIEVLNGKRYDLLHALRVPDVDTSQCGSVATLDNPCVKDSSGTPHVVDPSSCCEVQSGAVVEEPSKMLCADGTKTCSCDATQFDFQIAQNQCSPGKVAFPGGGEDWMNMLLARPDRPVIGTANSDSHDPTDEEPGTPRTYIAVGPGKDEPLNLEPDDILAAFKKGDVLMSEGPFLRVTATGDGAPVTMGGLVHPKGGVVHVDLHVESANWIVPTHVQVYVNGKAIFTANGNPQPKPLLDPAKKKQDVSIDVPATTDGFIVVEVTGSESMFPSVYPHEVPPLQFTDVLSALGSSFGGLGGATNTFKPNLIFTAVPYALTNPIWVDGDGDGKVSPQLTLPDPSAIHASTSRDTRLSTMKSTSMPWVQTEQEAAAAQWAQIPLRKRIALSRLPAWLWPSDQQSDVRRVLLQFVSHAD
jgi:hypothetical protein